MCLLELNYEHLVDVFVDYELGKGVLLGPMRVTQADLLVVVLVEVHVRAVKVLSEVFEAHPEYTVQLFIDLQLVTHMLTQFCRRLLPFKLPFTLGSCAIRVPDLDHSETLIIGPDLG